MRIEGDVFLLLAQLFQPETRVLPNKYLCQNPFGGVWRERAAVAQLKDGALITVCQQRGGGGSFLERNSVNQVNHKTRTVSASALRQNFTFI